MTINNDFARELCMELGIEWDESATAPTLRGDPVLEGDIAGFFLSSAHLYKSVGVTFTLGSSNYNNYNNVDTKCA